MKKPQVKNVIGMLLSADELDNGMVILNIQNVEDEVISVGTNNAYWKKVGKFLTVDSIVTANYEVRIANTTEYEVADSTDTTKTVVKQHTVDGNNLDKITRFSTSAYQRLLDSKDLDKGVEILNQVADEKVAAVGLYLAAFVRKL